MMVFLRIKHVQILMQLGIFMTFIGHGYFALQQKTDWLTYIEFFGFSEYISKKIILFIGVLDILIALIILIKPYKFVVVWVIIWTLSTALIRPITGESFFEFIERGSHFILPLCLYCVLFKKNINLSNKK